MVWTRLDHQACKPKQNMKVAQLRLKYLEVVAEPIWSQQVQKIILG